MLNVCKLSKQYGKTMAIQNISFQVNRGEIVGLVGHNGCGKSTSMNIITGYLMADEGSVLLDGEDHVEKANEVRKKIGYLPEVPPLYPDLTVKEQLMFACELKGIAHKRDSVQKACRKTDIAGASGRLIRNLSKGYKQRIGLAQAFLGDPPLLVLDEPSSGLDPCQASEMRDMICEAGKEHAILLSSHVLSEVAATCSRIVILSNGRLAADDTPVALEKRFCTPGLYQLTAAGNAEQFLRIFREKEGLAEVRKVVCEEEGTFSVQFLSEKKNVAELAIAALSEIGGILLSFGPVTPGLENVFLELTRDMRYGTEADLK